MTNPANMGDAENYRGWFIEWREEWSQFFSPHNWRTFHPIFVEFEDDRMMGAVECTLILLGLGFRWRWNYRVTDKVADIQKAVQEIKDGTTDSRPLSEFLAELKDEK